MTPRIRGLAAVLALVAAAGAGVWWWNRPARQIQRMLDDVASALTRPATESGLETLSAVATLRPLVAPDALVQIGESMIHGRDAVITAAARARARPGAMRLRFFDPRVTFARDREANLVATAEVSVTTDAGAVEVVVYQVTATVQRPQDRWLVSSARAVQAGKTES